MNSSNCITFSTPESRGASEGRTHIHTYIHTYIYICSIYVTEDTSMYVHQETTFGWSLHQGFNTQLITLTNPKRMGSMPAWISEISIHGASNEALYNFQLIHFQNA